MLRFELATQADDGEIRRLLRETSMDGDIRLTLEREPNASLAAGIAGDLEQTVVARDAEGGPILGMGSRSVRDCYLNGQVSRIGYLSQLRVDRGHRGRRHLLAGGYAALRRLHEDGGAPFYVSTIVADNRSARRLLEAGLLGFPTYRLLELLVTLVLPVTGRRRARGGPVEVARGLPHDLESIVDCLDRNLPRYQFAPRWGRGDLLSPTRTRGLSLGDFFVARRSDAMVGCLAIWDQGEFKQAVVRGYSRRLAVTRPLVNALAPLLRIPRLPAPGRTIRNAFLSHVAIDEDDPAVLLALLAAAYDDATKRSIDYLTIAFAGRNPLARVVKKAFPHREYPSMLYLVHWEDGAGAASEVDGRIPHLEAALL